MAGRGPADWEGPGYDANSRSADVLVITRKRYRVKPIRDELNGVRMAELQITKA